MHHTTVSQWCCQRALLCLTGTVVLVLTGQTRIYKNGLARRRGSPTDRALTLREASTLETGILVLNMAYRYPS